MQSFYNRYENKEVIEHTSQLTHTLVIRDRPRIGSAVWVRSAGAAGVINKDPTIAHVREPRTYGKDVNEIVGMRTLNIAWLALSFDFVWGQVNKAPELLWLFEATLTRYHPQSQRSRPQHVFKAEAL